MSKPLQASSIGAEITRVSSIAHARAQPLAGQALGWRAPTHAGETMSPAHLRLCRVAGLLWDLLAGLLWDLPSGGLA